MRADKAMIAPGPGVTDFPTAVTCINLELLRRRGSPSNADTPPTVPARQDLTEGCGVNEECPVGCCPHATASSDAGCPDDLPSAPLTERAAHLYACQLLSTYKIAAITGIDRPRITALLRKGGVRVTPSGAGRSKTRPSAAAEEPGQLMTRLRQVHRMLSGAPPARGPSEIELLTTLYADSRVRRALDRHGVPVAPLTGPVWERFPAPQPLTAGLVTDLYEDCGLSTHHIELLTGRPAAAAAAVLRASGVKLRPAGGRSPFMRRWREGAE
jgi:hypothetical protein